ncbi:MAG: hypothetical protein JWN86_2542 [Planctomycetota bacterium]|nr:hypothetical protein [Planctomycetota bacterium]
MSLARTTRTRYPSESAGTMLRPRSPSPAPRRRFTPGNLLRRVIWPSAPSGGGRRPGRVPIGVRQVGREERALPWREGGSAAAHRGRSPPENHTFPYHFLHAPAACKFRRRLPDCPKPTRSGSTPFMMEVVPSRTADSVQVSYMGGACSSRRRRQGQAYRFPFSLGTAVATLRRLPGALWLVRLGGIMVLRLPRRCRLLVISDGRRTGLVPHDMT